MSGSGAGKTVPTRNKLFGAKIYLLKSATRSKHFLMQIQAEKRKRSSSERERERGSREEASHGHCAVTHVLGPKLFFVAGLVIFVTAVARLVCPDRLG